MLGPYAMLLFIIAMFTTTSAKMEAPPVTLVCRIAIVSAYTCGPESTGKHRGDLGYCVTASGYKLKPSDSYRVVAADPKYYYVNQKIHIDNIGDVIVKDTGSDIKGKDRFDLFINDLDSAKKFGVKKLEYKAI
ncbi:MAG: 3D domain-containing protein [Nitrospiraceae bacterium]|nr:3D domain-containing protein [Nitrospiraceae bacterium]